MKQLILVIGLLAVMLAGCAPTDLGGVMGRTDGTPIPAPQKLDCDLIFPAPSIDP